MGHHGAPAPQAPPSALDLDARSVRPHDDGPASDARGLWVLCTNAPRPHCRLANRLPRPPQTSRAQSGSSSWRSVAQWGRRLTATAGAAPCTASHALPLGRACAVSGGHPRLGGLWRSAQLAPRARVRYRVHGPCSPPDASTPTLPTPCCPLPAAVQRVPHVLESFTHAQTGRRKRTALAVVEHAPPRRPIPEPHLPPLAPPLRVPRPPHTPPGPRPPPPAPPPRPPPPPPPPRGPAPRRGPARRERSTYRARAAPP